VIGLIEINELGWDYAHGCFLFASSAVLAASFSDKIVMAKTPSLTRLKKGKCLNEAVEAP
jgi:hypothetical protein